MSGYRYKGAGAFLPGIPAADIADEDLEALAAAQGQGERDLKRLLDGSGLYDYQKGVKPEVTPSDAPAATSVPPSGKK